MNPTLKRYLVSSLTTFLTAFIGSLALQLQAGALSPTNLTISAVLAVLATAARAAVKPVIEILFGTTGEPGTP